MGNFPGLPVKAILKIIKQLPVALSSDPVCGAEYVRQPWTSRSLLEHEPILQLSPFPAGESLHLSSCPCFPIANPFSPIVWIWLSFMMANVLRLPASAICLQTGDVKDLPKRALQSPEITARADGRQISAASRGQPYLPAKEPDFSSWIPSWHLTEGSCPYKVGQAWPLDHPLSLVHSKPRNKVLLKIQPCQT